MLAPEKHMKLRQIAETIAGHQLGAFMKSYSPGSPSLYFGRPTTRNTILYDPNNGTDSAAVISGNTQGAAGIPKKPRHRKFLGLSNRMGIF